LRTYLEFVPPLSGWVVPVFVLVLFLVLAEFGARRQWKRPGVPAMSVVLALICIYAFLRGSGMPEPTGHVHVLAPSVRRAAVTLVGAFVLLGAAASRFDRLRPKSSSAAIVAALMTGIIAVPVALIASLLLACMLDLSCI